MVSFCAVTSVPVYVQYTGLWRTATCIFAVCEALGQGALVHVQCIYQVFHIDDGLTQLLGNIFHIVKVYILFKTSY